MEIRTQWFDHVEELRDGTGPAVSDDQWQRVRVIRAGMDEMDPLTVDVGQEMRPAVDPLLLRAPVELRRPVVAEILEIRECGAVSPAAAGNLVGPPCTR